MKIGISARDVLTSFRTAWQFRWPFLVAHLLVRLLVLAIITPLASLLLSFAIATNGQSALTDQDIAYFLLTPTGLVAALVILCLLIAGAVLDVALMTSILRTAQRTAAGVLGHGLQFVISHFIALLDFSLRLIIRIFLISIPFLMIAAIVAAFSLTQYDINYYLTYWPPAFVIAASIIAVTALALAIVLIRRLSSWAIALHLVLFENQPPGKAFGESAQRLSGHKARLVTTLVAWVIARAVLGLAVAAMAGALFNILPGLFGANLRGIATATILLLLLWAFANAIVAALSNGALADLLYRLYLLGSPNASRAMATELGTGDQTSGASVPTGVLIAVAIVALVGGIFAGGILLENIGATRTVEIIAHRGASGSRPENTLAAINQAVDDRADWIEIDVQETADGEVVVAHDSDFMKLANVDLKVWGATMIDLADIDIGSWFDPSYSDERTPTLRQALEAVKDRGKVIIELKYYGHDVDLESRVARIVEEVEMVSDVAVMSLKYDGVRKMQALRPDWRYGVLAATAIGDLAALESDFLAVNTGQVSLQLIRRAHAQGKQIYVWTVDDPVTMSRMISMGVDGLITNEPALTRQVMEARNQLTTYQRLALWLTDRFRVGSFKLVAEETDA
jgi:glycerophosphoryl diester phosphodiesterase